MKKRCILVALAVVIAAALVWKLIPRSLNDALEVPGEIRVTKCWVTLTGVTDKAEPYIDIYELPEDVLPQVQSLLTETGYRPDWRMLLPWSVDSAGGNGLGISAMIFLKAGETEKILHLMGPNLMACFDGNRDCLYHFDNDALLQKLRDWALAKGFLQ